MRARGLIIVALVAIVALPFALRPKKPALAKADDALVIITSNNEAIRYEFGRGFESWYRARTGRTVAIDWRVLGGTSEIARFIEASCNAAFERYWTEDLGRPWSAEIQAGFVAPKLADDAPAVVQEAR